MGLTLRTGLFIHVICTVIVFMFSVMVQIIYLTMK